MPSAEYNRGFSDGERDKLNREPGGEYAVVTHGSTDPDQYGQGYFHGYTGTSGTSGNYEKWKKGELKI